MNTKKNHYTMIIMLITLAFMVSITPLAHAGVLSEGFNATYYFSKNDMTVAKVTRRLYVVENVYDFSSFAKTAGIAAFVSDETIKERSILERVNNRLRSHYYSLDKKSSKHINTIIFNWSNQTIISNSINQNWPLTDNAFDLLGFQLALADALHKQQSPLLFTIAEEKRIGEYQLTLQGEETLELASRTLNTIRVSYTDPVKKRTFTFWCARQLDYLPVRVTREDADGDITRLELASWQGPVNQD